MYTVGQIGKLFKLSRSALLYYDEIGLLSPSARSSSNYRLYSYSDVRRMERIMIYRDAGLPLGVIGKLLQVDGASAPAMLERHLSEINREIAKLRQQQRVVAKLLDDAHVLRGSRSMTKDQWVALLASTGLDENGMRKWHIEFEKMSPEAHQDFLESLGILQEEITVIRRMSPGQEVADHDD
ncbi:MAG TPA: MerR family transcriptional regulator [Burkholderiaceae bacterium]|nr:MerR family transcriptional regulator [Burkholderiaceae bacterium]